jgi:hypothetical protein
VRSSEQNAYASPASHPTAGSFAAPLYGPSQPGDPQFLQRDRHDESEDIELILHPSDSHTVSLSQLLFVAIVTAACITVWNNRFHFLPDADRNITYAKPPQVLHFEPAPIIAATVPLASVQDSGQSGPVALAPINVPLQPSKKGVLQKSPSTKKGKQAAKRDTLLVALPVVEQMKDEVPPDTIATTPEPTTVAPQAAEKKKTLGQAIKNIFKKKKKKDDSVPEEQ